MNGSREHAGGGWEAKSGYHAWIIYASSGEYSIGADDAGDAFAQWLLDQYLPIRVSTTSAGDDRTSSSLSADH